MTLTISHVATLGDAERTFTLTDDAIAELEKIAGTGVAAIYHSLTTLTFKVSILPEIVRLGLIGAGTSPDAAKALTDAHARNCPLDAVFPLALDILDARWTGKPAKVEAAK